MALTLTRIHQRMTDDERKKANKYAENERHRSMKGESNRHFAEKNARFRQACQNAGVEPTVRQASKFRNGEGKAYANR